jgi:hypothetical protein
VGIFGGACAATDPYESLRMFIAGKLLMGAPGEAFDHEAAIALLPT